jgi:hypothetical protein
MPCLQTSDQIPVSFATGGHVGEAKVAISKQTEEKGEEAKCEERGGGLVQILTHVLLESNSHPLMPTVNIAAGQSKAVV